MIDNTTYEYIIADALDTIAKMRLSGNYDEPTLNAIEKKLLAVKENN